MKVRQGFVSNSSTSSYIYLVAEIGKLTDEAKEKIKEMGYLLRMVRNKKQFYFGHQIYDGFDDAFFLTGFDTVEKAKEAYFNMYNQFKDEFGLGPVSYCNDVAYDERWIQDMREIEEYEAESQNDSGD